MVISVAQKIVNSSFSGSEATSIAVVSGKGGSGKTMIAVALAQAASLAGKSVMLIDADLGTGGLTYYLSFRVFGRLRTGLTDVIGNPALIATMADWAASAETTYEDYMMDGVRLVPVGNHARIRDILDDETTDAFSGVVRKAKELVDVVIIDCRGGFDFQSLSVCTTVDQILVVVETDATSIRASQHLVSELGDNQIKAKVSGFVLNKVIDDPTTLAMTANSLLQVDYLGAVPFDIEATRSYIQGRVPERSSLFSQHVFSIASRLMRGMEVFENVRTLAPSEFSNVTLGRPELKVGAIFVVGTALYASLGLLLYMFSSKYAQISLSREFVVYLIIAGNMFLILSQNDRVKQAIGEVVRRNNQFIRRMVLHVTR